MHTTAAAIRTIIELDAALPDATIELHAADAALVIDEVIGTELGPAQLESVNRWLGAHLIASGLVPQNKSETISKASATYQQVLGKGLASTMYGVQAMALDTTGRLAAWDKRQTTGAPGPSITYLGS